MPSGRRRQEPSLNRRFSFILRCYPQPSAARQNWHNFPVNLKRFVGTTCGDGVVPIRRFLDGRIFDAEAINEMSLAFDDACDELGLVNSAHDPATSIVAEKIIEVAQRGVHDPDQLRTMALNELGRG
jgi:hypothetical protein